MASKTFRVTITDTYDFEVMVDEKVVNEGEEWSEAACDIARQRLDIGRYNERVQCREERRDFDVSEVGER